jgi:F-type H+-transporting ATPase subunit epsilon
MLEVTLISPSKIVFKGQAKSVVLPGEYGVFEVLLFHKPIMSRLLKGRIEVDDKSFPILRGVVKVQENQVTAIVEQG